VTTPPVLLHQPPEREFAHELEALARADTHARPPGWRLSPRAVTTYLLGGTVGDVRVSAKYLGHPRLIEVAVATLATDRALLLAGEPGTAKSWLSEHLAAAISATSQEVIQGTAGTTEEQLRYGWNYALLLSRGPSAEALVSSPVLRAMEAGTLVRVEELTRCPAEVQDALISLLSEKSVAIPELGLHVAGVRGFNLIATANTRDRGVHEMSSALRRRFNVVVLPVPEELELEVAIVRKRVGELATALALPAAPPPEALVRTVVQIFQELRRGQTLDGQQKLKSPTGTLSTAEAIAILTDGMSLAGHFRDGEVVAADVAPGLRSAVVREASRDAPAWTEYLENVVRRRGRDWEALHAACRELG
jgi:MoxR-like ATPase